MLCISKECDKRVQGIYMMHRCNSFLVIIISRKVVTYLEAHAIAKKHTNTRDFWKKSIALSLLQIK